MAALVLALSRCALPAHRTASSTQPPTPAGASPSLPSSGARSPSPLDSPSASPSPSAAPDVSPSPTASSAPSPGPTASGPPALAIASLPWHQGEVGVDYGTVPLSASGGTPPYRWSVVSGALPAGMMLSAGGSVSGTPQQVPQAGFTVQVADAAGQVANAATSIPIAAALALSYLCGASPNSFCDVESGCNTVCGNFGQQSGGVGPFQYSSSGTLPSGTSLNGLALAGTFTGGAARYYFTVTVVDALGVKASLAPYFSVINHLVLSNGSGGGPLPNGPATVRMPLASADWKITRVSTNSPYTVTNFTYDGTTLTITLSGTFNSTTPPPFQATVYDSHPCGPGVNCSSTATVTLSMG